MSPDNLCAVLDELRQLVQLDEVRAPFDDATYERMVETTKKLIDDNYQKAAKEGAPELAGSWIEIIDALTAVEPQTMRDSKTVSAETMRVRKTLASEGYLFYKAPGSKFEFVYAPGQTPAHAKIAELKELRKQVNAKLRAAAPDEKDEHKKAIKDLDKQIKDQETSNLMQASIAAEAKAQPESDEPAPLQDTPEMKRLAKEIKAAEKEVSAAKTPAETTAAEKKLADLQAQLRGETGKAQKAHAAGTPAQKPGKVIVDPDDPGFDPTKPGVPPDAVAMYWRRKRVGGYEQTADALKGLEKYGQAMYGALDVLEKDPTVGKFTSDRKTRLTNLLKTLRDTVVGAERELEKVGVPKKTAAEEVKYA